jgi:uncharacterized protein YdeI (YjbR/CyaY-like superfamily)
MLYPSDLVNALRHNPKAEEAFMNLSPSQQKEYVKWIENARYHESRAQRVADTMQLILDNLPKKP